MSRGRRREEEGIRSLEKVLTGTVSKIISRLRECPPGNIAEIRESSPAPIEDEETSDFQTSKKRGKCVNCVN